ncbi:O-antigen ligase family protein [Flavobacterium sp. SM2513]|uniref:O-antigen ligase family protein n=1 Tax=Flavobacterium sp. SM2513 TaxID=3424766 RepID=UPI003D7FD3AF
MIISEKNHSKIFNFFLVTIASLMIFRIPCTIVIILFVFYNLFNIDKLIYSNTYRNLVLVISLPLIINVLFLWNNSSLYEGIKAIEKYLALLFLPLFIIGNFKYISMNSLLKRYTIILVLILTILLVRYIFYFPDFFNKYWKGIHLWELGYSFSNSFSNHAPALNMHISFALIYIFYLILNNFTFSEIKIKYIILWFLLFAVLFFFLLFVNTRLALVNTLIGFFIIVIYQFSKSIKKEKSFSTALGLGVVIIAVAAVFLSNNPYMIKKYTTDTFSNLDKIGKLDEIDNARAVAYNSLVTRLSILKSATELGLRKPVIGYGSADSKSKLCEYYKETRQYFLYKNQLPVHNQVIDFFLKFGIFGILIFGVYFWNILRIGYYLKNPLIISFFVIFLISNFFDDFLIRFDGIVYSGFWISIFASEFIKKKNVQIQDNTIIANG